MPQELMLSTQTVTPLQLPDGVGVGVGLVVMRPGFSLVEMEVV